MGYVLAFIGGAFFGMCVMAMMVAAGKDDDERGTRSQ